MCVLVDAALGPVMPGALWTSWLLIEKAVPGVRSRRLTVKFCSLSDSLPLLRSLQALDFML